MAECRRARCERSSAGRDAERINATHRHLRRIAGTGKTYSVARLIGAVGERDGWESVAVCCPTGKAASRITEAMQGYGLPLRAKTIHSLLKVASKEEGEGWGFEHNEHNPLPFRYVFLDEASMPDADIMAALLRALPAGAHLMLVGDTNQLPPVGHGAPLRDLIPLACRRVN